LLESRTGNPFSSFLSESCIKLFLVRVMVSIPFFHPTVPVGIV
jgi:hypothetical protein